MYLTRPLFLALSLASLLTAQTKFGTDVLALNPVGFWPLHGNANDASTRSNNGVIHGVTFNNFVGPLGTGASPAAIFSSAQQQFVSVNGGGALLSQDGLHPFTAMAWIRTMNQGQDFMAIAAKYDAGSGTGWAFGLDNSAHSNGVFGAGRLSLAFDVATKTVLFAQTTVSLNDGNWHLVAVAYDGSGKSTGARFYIDGVPFAAEAADGSISGSPVNSVPFTIGAAPNGEAAFEGFINEVAIFPVALTADQNLQLAEDAMGFRRILPQFAFGGGWYSAVYFTNSGAAPLTFPVNFLREDGSPLNISSIGGSSKTISLAPGATTVIEAPNTGDLVQGYVSAITPVGIAGYGIFRQSVAGIADQEAVVPFSGAGAGYQALLYDDTKGLVTGVAIANPSGVAITVGVTVLDANGNSVGTSSIVLQSNSKTAVALRSLPGLSRIAGTQGTAQFQVTAPTNGTGSIAILGLRFNGSAFTSMPAFGRPGI